MEKDKRVSSVSHSQSIAEMAEFWDTHDATDFHDQTHQVDMEFNLHRRRHYLAIEPELLSRLREQAESRGVGLESLANLWLQERVLAHEG
jgi:hypothetical protein